MTAPGAGAHFSARVDDVDETAGAAPSWKPRIGEALWRYSEAGHRACPALA